MRGQIERRIKNNSPIFYIFGFIVKAHDYDSNHNEGSTNASFHLVSSLTTLLRFFLGLLFTEDRRLDKTRNHGTSTCNRIRTFALGIARCGIGDFNSDIAYLTGRKGHVHSERRMDAYRDAMEAHGLPVREDRMNRAKNVRPEIDFILEREKTAGLLMNLMREGSLPLRVTHNDTKLNNVMLDEKTRQPLCILDLDTVMPGLVANDFGESVRFGASTAAEDEPDTEKVHVDLKLYEAFAEGFLGACGTQLSETEKETLPDGARMMSLENGMRFLTDYLEGDTYFHIARPEHNLDRCRAQLALVREMETYEKQIRTMIRQIRGLTP